MQTSLRPMMAPIDGGARWRVSPTRSWTVRSSDSHSQRNDLTFHPFLFVPRERQHDSPIDIKGAGQSVTVVVWAIRKSGNHAITGIWHEETDLRQNETARDLVALRLNPWWFPHDLYRPKDDGSGGPFTIGRVIHSSRIVGFTGWIGGVAVFDRALNAEELSKLSSLSKSAQRK